MIEVNAQEGKAKLVGLVRNKQGEPQFDDYNNIPEVFHSALTEDDWVYIESQVEQMTKGA